MTKLYLDTLQMPAAPLGPENPLPPMRNNRNASSVELENAPPRPVYPDRGGEGIILPYRLQDAYTRDKKPRDFKTAVLENDHIRATFTLELGGRLWSLIDKDTGKELLSVNPVFQPCNLAIRNAWSSGGVEWNLCAGLMGHHPLTCEPLFAARVVADDGSPVLRIYEWERGRQIPFQLDFILPNNSKYLFLRARVTNPHSYVVPIYWWTNIAAPEKKGARVLSPATSGLRHSYDGKLFHIDVPFVKGVDETYTTNGKTATDLYFDIQPGQRPWIAWVDTDGTGLMHATTEKLIGRKLWNWGQHPGSQHWQDWLAEPGVRYLEIQAGLGKTQAELVPMPAGAVFEWTEAFGPLAMDAKTVHGEWNGAVKAINQNLDQTIPPRALDDLLQSTRALADRSPTEVLHHGHGWAALENRRRKAAGETGVTPTSMPIPDASISGDQSQWLALLEKGELPNRNPTEDPGSLMVQKHWQKLLEDAINAKRGAHWLAWYHLGLMRYRQGDREAAKAAWNESIKSAPSAWAYRNLAEAAREENDHSAAVDLLLKAVRLAPVSAPLAIECGEAIVASKRGQDIAKLLDIVTPAVRTEGRLRMLVALAAIDQGDFAPVQTFFKQHNVITTIRENELSVTDLWYTWQAHLVARRDGIAVTPELKKRLRAEMVPPPEYEFRMRPDPT